MGRLRALAYNRPMKNFLVGMVVIVGVWAVIFTVGRGRNIGVDQGPANDGIAAERLGDRFFQTALLHDAEATIAAWPMVPQQAARSMLEKYGVPDAITAKKLVWNDSGPWKRTIVHRDAGRDVLEQVAVYHIPNDRYDMIRRLEGNVSAERGRDELTAKSDREALNLLSLNLADEVISGKRGAADARTLYVRVKALALSGKSSPYTQGLLFSEPVLRTAP